MAADSTMFLIVNLLIALSLGVHLEQLLWKLVSCDYDLGNYATNATNWLDVTSTLLVTSTDKILVWCNEKVLEMGYHTWTLVF